MSMAAFISSAILLLLGLQSKKIVKIVRTTDKIRTCSNVLWDGVHKVVAMNDELVVTFGTCVRIPEGQTLIHLERHAPEVWLDGIWLSLTESEKDDITTMLKHTFDTMRQAECPRFDFYGGLDGGSLPHYLFYSQKKDEPAFVVGLVVNLRALIERNNRPDFKVRFYEAYLPRQKNIVVKETEDRKNSQGERSFDVTLVDWAIAGWFPDYWEFFCASSPIIFPYWEEDWCWRLPSELWLWA
ncbi:hypothetical protein BDV06DRAFT_234606 [Aspergillus oleicola]